MNESNLHRMTPYVEPAVCISNERFVELIRKEERLEIITRMLNKLPIVTTAELRTVLDIEKETTDEIV